MPHNPPQYRHQSGGMSSTPSKNERLAQALAARETEARLHRKGSSASSASEDQFRDVQDDFPAGDGDEGDGDHDGTAFTTPSLGQGGKRSIDTAWDESEFQRQAADRMSKYSMMTRYDGEGEGDDDVEANDVTYGHNRTGSVGSSIWAGQGALSPTSKDFPTTQNGQSPARGSTKKKGGNNANIVPPIPTSSAAFQHFRNEGVTASPPLFGDDDGPFGRPDEGEDLRSAFNTPNPDADESRFASTSSRSTAPTRALPAIPNGKPGKLSAQRKGRSKRSPVLSYDGAAEDEERKIRASGYEDEDDDAREQLGEEQARRDDSNAALERHISHLGPKVRKHEPAPWEMQGDDESEAASYRSSPMPASPQPQSAWAKLTRGSLDVREREATDARRGLGLGVNLRRPSGDTRRPSPEGSDSPAYRQRQLSQQSATPSSRPRHPLEHSSSSGSGGGIPARDEALVSHPSQASLPSVVSMPTTPTASSNLGASQNAHPPIPPIPYNSRRPSDSVYSTTSTVSGPGTPGKPRPRTKSVSKVLKGLGIGGSGETTSQHEGGTQSNKLAKALKKKGERNELSLAQGISSDDFKDRSPVPDGEPEFDLATLRSGANKNLVNPLTGRPSATGPLLGAHQPDAGRSTSSLSGQIPSISTADGSIDSGVSYSSAQPSDASHLTRATTHSALNSGAADASHSYSSKATSYGTADSSSTSKGGLAPVDAMSRGSVSPSPSRQLSPSPVGSAYATPPLSSNHTESYAAKRQESLESTRGFAGEHTMDTMRAGSATPTASGILGSHAAKAQQNIERRSSPQPPSPVIERTALPQPGSHEGVSYKLISLEQAQAEAKARQQGYALQRSGSYTGEQDSSTSSSGEHGRVSAGSAAMASERSHSSLGGHSESESGIKGGVASSGAGGKGLKGKKSGILRMFNRGSEKNASDEGSSAAPPPMPTAPSARGPDFKLPAEGREVDEGGDKLGDFTSSSKSSNGLAAPALASIRPVSSMLAGFSPAFIGDDKPTTTPGLSPVEAAASALEGKQSLPATKANQLASSRGHSPADIAIPAASERKSRDQAKTPTDGSGARESSVFHSPATSPGHLPMNAATNGALSGRDDGSADDSMLLPLRPSKAPQRSGSESGQTLALPAPGNGPDARSRQLSVGGSSSTTRAEWERERTPSAHSSELEPSNPHLEVVNGFSAAPASPSPSSAAGTDSNDVTLAVKNRVATIEAQMAALVDELRHLRATHMPPQSSSSLPPPTSATSSADGGAGSSPIPSCDSCGCNCADMRRLQAENEMQVLKGLGTSVMDRGRGVKKRHDETIATRFGGL